MIVDFVFMGVMSVTDSEKIEAIKMYLANESMRLANAIIQQRDISFNTYDSPGVFANLSMIYARNDEYLDMARAIDKILNC